MKKIVLLLVALLSFGIMQADDYLPLLREGVKWVYLEELTNCSPEDEIVIARLYTIEVKGDTTINDIVYKKVYRTSNTPDYYGAALCSNTQPVACLREERTKVYAKVLNDDYSDVPFLEELLSNVSTNGEVILYEFDEDEGSPCTLIGTTTVGSTSCNVYSCEWLYGELIEGVGLDTDSYGDYLLFSRSATTGYPYSYIGLHHMEDADGNIIYYGMAFNGDAVSGDVDGSGIVDVSDVNAVINIILKQKSVSDYLGNGDMDGNGYIDVEDVNAIINIILKVNK